MFRSSSSLLGQRLVPRAGRCLMYGDICCITYVFLLFLGMVMFANDVETKEK